MEEYQDISGLKFGKLTAEFYGGKLKVDSRWICRCDCGELKVTTVRSLKSGRSTSCGCDVADAENTQHPMYARYDTMKSRCYDTHAINYKDYGGRGVKVCDRWLEDGLQGFRNFLEDMGPCPDGYQIDRDDVNGNYCKENCRWTDLRNQHFNTRMHKTNTSGRTGVHLNKTTNKWTATIRVDGKMKYLMSSFSFEKACKAREKAEIDVYGYTKE